jgi:ubiquinone/menaquinone biosynthesis C-methylase UbiE
MKLIRSLIANIGNLFFKKHSVSIYSNSYDNIAPHYDQTATRNLLSQETEKLINSLVFYPKMRCLDLGCGTGHGSELIDSRVSPGGLILGCDISESMINIAKEKSKTLKTTSFVKEDMLTALFKQKNSSFDLITSFWAIGYSNNIQKVLKEINRVLTDDGCAAILVNTQESLAEMQSIVTRIFVKNPFVLRRIPPMGFPSDLKKFKSMIKQSELKTNSITEEMVDYSFATGDQFIHWMKTGGPCAGFKYFLRKKYEDYAFEKIKEEVDRQNGITVTFKFLRFIGGKQCINK